MATLRRVAVILMNLGGPTSLDAVRPFLFNLFYDPAILRVPNPFRWCLATLISWSRASKAKKIYEKLGGKSPLLEETQQQAKALEKFLKKREGVFKVFIAMRYWHPFARETMKDVLQFNSTDIVLLPLYPQFSTTTTQSSLDDFCKRITGGAKRHVISNFFSHNGFSEVMAEGVHKIYNDAKKYGMPRILWTAHGLPKKIIDSGDPYQSQVEQTVSLLEKKLEGMGDFESVICYQSRVGPLEWIGPYTEDEIIRAGKDKAPLIVVPLSFVSEHSETLVELDMDYKELAENNGVPFYGRVPTVRDDPRFIEGLVELIMSNFPLEAYKSQNPSEESLKEIV